METYLFLEIEDKNKIQKLGQSKQLSLSTLADIIHKHYYWLIDKEIYYLKGTKQIHIKPRNEINQKTNCLIFTNCIYAYLHNEVIKTHEKSHLKKINSKIQSELDKTYDPNFNKNIILREMYRAKAQLGL